MSATHEEHDVTTLVFLLEPAEAAGLRETEEGLRRMGEQTRVLLSCADSADE